MSCASCGAENRAGRKFCVECGSKLALNCPACGAAVGVAHGQSAKFLELRATVSLSRLLKRQGKRIEARAMLSNIYNWFTEGFDTADLKDAKALLEELNA